MQHDPLWPDLTFDLRSNVGLGLLKLNWIEFDLSRGKKHNTDTIVGLGATGQKLLNKNYSAEN